MSVVLRRARDVALILLIVSTIMFFLLRAIPGSPGLAILGPMAPPEQVHALDHRLGVDKPLWEQYLSWITSALHGDLGYSLSQDDNVSSVIAAYLVPTLIVALLATFFGIAIAVPVAIHSVLHPTTVVSRFLLAASSALLAVPGFWLALGLVLILAVRNPFFPVSGYVPPTTSPLEFAHHLFIPMVVLLAYQVPLLVLTLRESLAGEMLSAYARTARAKGASENQVMYRHLLRNAFLPALTLIGLNFGGLLGGVVILETIFIIPGLGYLLYGAIAARDYNLLLGITVVAVIVTVLANLIVDLLYGVLDPRVRRPS